MHYRHTYMTALITLTMLGCVTPVYAAELLIEPNASTVRVGDELVLNVGLDAQGASINVVDGSIVIPPGLEIIEISHAGSAVMLWATTPTYSIADRSVMFTAGMVPAIRGTGHLFSLRTRVIDGGAIVISGATSAYADDGQGSAVPISVRAEAFEIGEQTVAKSPSHTGSTSKLVAEIGKDPALFDGAWFVSIYGGDTGQGISYYEIQEEGYDPVRVERLYVLRDQDLNSEIKVSAVAPDGTRTTETLNDGGFAWPILAIIIGILCIVGVWFTRFRI